MRTNKSGRRRDISEHQDLESPRQRRRGGRQEYIDVEHDGTDYIEDDSAIQAFADSFGLASGSERTRRQPLAALLIIGHTYRLQTSFVSARPRCS